MLSKIIYELDENVMKQNLASNIAGWLSYLGAMETTYGSLGHFTGSYDVETYFAHSPM